jgi:hypothetical protein
MKLTYAQLGLTFDTLDTTRWPEKDGANGSDQQTLRGAVDVVGNALGLPAKSIWYLLQNGWSQSLQDSFAGPRAKAIKDGEDESTIEAVIHAAIAKRVESIMAGLLSSGSNGRDPIRTIAKDLLQKKADSLGKRLPKDKDKLAKLIDSYIAANRLSIDNEIRRRRSSQGNEVDLSDIIAE